MMILTPGGYLVMGPPAQAGRGTTAYRGTNHEQKKEKEPADQGEDKATLEGEEGTHSP
jgi:hypothetical protein